MPDDTLDVFLNGTLVGRLSPHSGAPSFTYDESYRSSTDPTPLSLSLPLQRHAHTGPHVEHRHRTGGFRSHRRHPHAGTAARMREAVARRTADLTRRFDTR